MSFSTTALSDSLPSSIPKLESTGLNWAIFSVRFRDAVEAKGFWGHFDGTTPCPILSPTVTTGTTTTGPTAEQIAAEAQWQKDERSAKSLLTQKIPDGTLLRIHAKTTVKSRWEAIELEYTEKGDYAKTELRAKFLEMRCLDKASVRDFLFGLRVKKEELAKVGVKIDDKDYLSTIISSLPFALSNFASAQLAAARMFSASKSIDPDVLISLLMEEADRQKAQRARRQGSGKGKEDEKDEALAVTAGSSKVKGGKNGKGGGGSKKHVTCWNCGEKGHFKNKCPKPPKSKDRKEDSPDKKATTSTANAAESDSEGEGAWAMWDSDSDDDSDDSASDIISARADEDFDWFSEVAEGACVADDEDWSTNGSDEPEDAFVAANGAESSPEGARFELFDSGCTQHISPYCNNFENFHDIPPKTFRAANKQSFSAIGKGDLVINVPDGTEVSRLRLTEVLYSPEVGYTLVSVS